jgi:uncharacterized cupin superfamily protein
MPDEARLEQVVTGLTPVSDGWFVVNARDAAWIRHDTFGLRCPFETSGPVARAGEDVEQRTFPQVGYSLAVLAPGEAMSLYHAEQNQEDFLVLSGACTCVIEERERQLQAWDFVHCPPGTRHAFVGSGEGPCVLLAIGARGGDHGVRYDPSAAAAAHGASVETATDSPAEAYAGRGHWRNEGPPNPAGL